MILNRYLHRIVFLLAMCTSASEYTTAAQQAFSVEGITYVITSSNTVKMGNGNDRAISSSTQYVTIPQVVTNSEINYTVTEIAPNAFSNITPLKTITLPASIEKIDVRSIITCTSLGSIWVHEDNQYLCDVRGVLFSKDTTTLIKFPALNTPNYIIPTSVDSIAESAFDFCRNLKSVGFPRSLRKIGRSAFYFCNSLTDIILPEGLTYLGMGAFASCSGIRSVNIPTSLGSVPKAVFQNCTQLSTVIIPEGIKSIGEMAFYRNALNKVTLPQSLEEINKSAFSMCTNLRSISFPKNLTAIRRGAFRSCQSLKKVILPEGLTVLDTAAFTDCYSLDTLIIPRKINIIDPQLLSGCTSLRHVSIPNQITWIRESAFYNCKSLQSVQLPSNLTYIASSAFGSTQLKTINIPASMGNIGMNAFSDCDSLLSIIFQGDKEPATIEKNAFRYSGSKLRTLTLPNAASGFGSNGRDNNKWCADIIDYQKISSIPQLENTNIDIKTANGCVIIEQTTGLASYAIYTMHGALVAQGKCIAHETVVPLPTGVYVVNVDNKRTTVHID